MRADAGCMQPAGWAKHRLAGVFQHGTLSTLVRALVRSPCSPNQHHSMRYNLASSHWGVGAKLAVDLHVITPA
jgi:hypothetical protein